MTYSRGQIAARVRQHKAENPHLYCRVPACLWRIETSRGPNPCKKHPLVTPESASTGWQKGIDHDGLLEV